MALSIHDMHQYLGGGLCGRADNPNFLKIIYGILAKIEKKTILKGIICSSLAFHGGYIP